MFLLAHTHTHTRKGKRRVATQGTQRTTPPPQQERLPVPITRNLTARVVKKESKSRENFKQSQIVVCGESFDKCACVRDGRGELKERRRLLF